jgi:serine/threonine-protein kinase RsbW/stage II sporulation protein AB (anti-sigma F factor)
VLSEQWSLPATVDNVPRLRGQALRFAREHDVQEPPIGDLAIALGEAITNAVVHGFRHGDAGTMTVSLAVDPDASLVKAVVRDDGIGFGPNPDSPGLGYGMRLIETLADSVAIRAPKDGRGTEVCMTFHLPVGSD